MTNYCTVTDVQNLIYGLAISASSQINTGMVGGWITDQSLILDALIKNRYRTPLEEVESLVIAKVVVSYLVTSLIFSEHNRSSGKAFKIDDLAYDQIMYKQGKELYKEIKKGELILSDGDLLESPSKSYMNKYSDTAVIDQDKNMQHVWKKNVTQW